MIIIFRAITGAGKSSAIQFLGTGDVVHQGLRGTALFAELGMLRVKIEDRPIYVYSADNYFTDEHGNYNFDPAHLSAASSLCSSTCPRFAGTSASAR